jgi:hypothetical protein
MGHSRPHAHRSALRMRAVPELIVFSLSDFAKTSASAKADGFLP